MQNQNPIFISVGLHRKTLVIVKTEIFRIIDISRITHSKFNVLLAPASKIIVE